MNEFINHTVIPPPRPPFTLTLRPSRHCLLRVCAGTPATSPAANHQQAPAAAAAPGVQYLGGSGRIGAWLLARYMGDFWEGCGCGWTPSEAMRRDRDPRGLVGRVPVGRYRQSTLTPRWLGGRHGPATDQLRTTDQPRTSYGRTCRS